jgi:cytochrome c biogenesis factor
LEFFLSALLITLLGVAYVKGYDVVKRHSAEHLVHFYLLMAVIRMLLVTTAVAIYVICASDREGATHFAASIMIMYALMMVVTLSMRH